MAEKSTHYADINGHYKAKSPVLPEKLRKKESDNYLAFLIQRLPIKASSVGGSICLGIILDTRFRLSTK